jgi:predicted aspartyl protease
MVKRFFAFLFATLVFAAPALAEDCSLKQAVSLDMATNYPGRVVVNVSIAGKPHHFLVDTGGFLTSIFQDLASGLGLETHAVDQSVEIFDVRGGQMKRYTKIPDLMIGSMKGDDIPVIVIPRSPSEQTDIDGILGPDIFSRFDLDFDFAGHKLNLILPDHCPGKAVYWSKNFADADFRISGLHVVLNMMLDGHEVRAAVDTGSARTHLYDNVARNMFGLENMSPGMEPIPGIAPGSLEQFRYRFKSLSIGGLAINNPTIYILPNLAQQSFSHNHLGKEELDPQYAPRLDSPDVILGMDVISKLHLYIAYKEHKLYLTPADAH